MNTQASEITEFVPAGHFYSVVPSREDINKQYSKGLELPLGIDINRSRQFELLESFSEFYGEMPFSPEKSLGLNYYFENPAYSYTDGIILYSMLRSLKPKNVIEIGSGFSSSLMFDTNKKFLNNSIDLTFIEPYPAVLESSLNNDFSKVNLHSTFVQNIDLNIFRKLEKNDILFIDSTHVFKTGSDLQLIMNKILPSLNKGVIIHFHDIFYPFEMPKDWIEEGRLWNENYILGAFLQYNSKFTIEFFNHYANIEFADYITQNMPLCRKNFGGGLWLKVN